MGNARYVRIDSKTVVETRNVALSDEEVREAYLAKVAASRPWIMSMGVTPYQVSD